MPYSPADRPEVTRLAQVVLLRLRGSGPAMACVGGRRVGRDACGLFHPGCDVPFGVACGGELFLKAGPETVTKYLARRMRTYRPGPAQTLRGYWSVPADVLDDERLLAEWAGAALRAVLQYRGGRLRRPRPRRRKARRDLPAPPATCG